MNRQRIYTITKWIFAFLAYAFLAYKLFTFEQYDELVAQWKLLPLSQYWWLAGVIFLLPLNLLVEAIKWQRITRNTEKISLKASIKAVFAGISTGFFTPNRIGEVMGRTMYLSAENRRSGITLSIVNSLTQNLTFLILGIPASLFFFFFAGLKRDGSIFTYILFVSSVSILFFAFYFALPYLSRKVSNNKWLSKAQTFTTCLNAFPLKEQFLILVISILRYFVFGLQYYMMLRFFGIDLLWWQALIAIPTNYLFITFTPSFSFSEVAVRGSYAVLVFSAFSSQTVSIALAGAGIWLINSIIPVITGSIFVIRAKK